MHPYLDLHRQLAHDRRQVLTRRADETRMRRDVRAIRRQLKRTG